MGGFVLKVALLSSSRADFGIYYPLAKILKEDQFFDLEIVAFGTHLSDKFGNTINEIRKLGFDVKHQLITIPEGDSPRDISRAIGVTIEVFSDFWSEHNFDLILALGDRYEMFAAVSAASPFNIDIAHIHAGETTLGAIDNAYRHSISLMSKYLFVSNEEYRSRGIEIIQNDKNVFNVGALSIDNLVEQDLYSKNEFKDEFNIDLSIPSILTTIHPETISLDLNHNNITEFLTALNDLRERFQIVITMPNSDTMGLMFRKKIEVFSEDKSNIKLVESFGMKGYLSCMKHCRFMLGNTSSGFVEAAFFPKWVINVGNRQKGRFRTPNIIDCEFSSEQIINSVDSIEGKQPQQVCVYGNGSAALLISEKLKQLY